MRHINGRLMWLQQLMRNKDLEIKQISTLYNIADINTKSLPRDRFFALLWMVGYVTSHGRVGEAEYFKLQSREASRKQVAMVNRILEAETETDSVPTAKLNKFAKQVLRILAACSVMTASSAVELSEDADSKALSLSSPMTEILMNGGLFGNSYSWYTSDFWMKLFIVTILFFALIFVRMMLRIRRELADMRNMVGQLLRRVDELENSVRILEQNDDESESKETAEEKRARYSNCNLSEVSDPDFWQEVNHLDDLDDDSNNIIGDGRIRFVSGNPELFLQLRDAMEARQSEMRAMREQLAEAYESNDVARIESLERQIDNLNAL